MSSSPEFGSFNADAPVGYAPGAFVPTTPAVPTGFNHRNETSGDQPSATDVAKDQATNVAGGAAAAAQHVAGVAKEQAGQVTAEAGKQAKQLLGQAQSELSEQAQAQQSKLAGGLHSVGDQLKAMATGSDQPGTATDLAHQAADKAHQVAGWLEDRDPAAVLGEVRSFARQRPGTFLALAVGAGLLAGRLARGLAADPDEVSSSSQPGAKHVAAIPAHRPAAIDYPIPAGELR